MPGAGDYADAMMRWWIALGLLGCSAEDPREQQLQRGADAYAKYCAICHGDALTGLGEVPRLAGLQPVYIARQLIQMQNGTSAGTNAALMKKVVANLSEDDIIAISAYLGSLPPR